MDKTKEKAADAIYARVLKEIKPSDVEVKDITAKANVVMHRLRKIAKDSIELRVAGSIARGTNLKGTADIDIFMLFDKKTKRDELVRRGLSYGRKLASGKKDRYEIKYAEHAYVRLYLDSVGIRVDLVPALKIDNIEEMGTTVDRTPLHTQFILKNLTTRQKDEVRLLKYLLKAHNIYGAEVKIGGFPGYLCELLIHHFGSLTTLLESAADFKLPVVLEPNTRRSLADAAIAKRFNAQFVVIDPVDKDRNVGAGVSLESLSKFAMVARCFVDKPDIGIFYGKGFPSTRVHTMLEQYMKLTDLDFFLIIANVPDKTEDVIWPQLRKSSDMISDYLKRSGFDIYLHFPWIEKTKGFILIATTRARISTRMLKGPSAFMGAASSNFVKDHPAHLGFVFKDDVIYALEKNEYPEVKDILEQVIKGKLMERRKDISLKSAKLFVNKIPAEYSKTAYVELCKRISI